MEARRRSRRTPRTRCASARSRSPARSRIPRDARRHRDRTPARRPRWCRRPPSQRPRRRSAPPRRGRPSPPTPPSRRDVTAAEELPVVEDRRPASPPWFQHLGHPDRRLEEDQEWDDLEDERNGVDGRQQDREDEHQHVAGAAVAAELLVAEDADPDESEDEDRHLERYAAGDEHERRKR